MSGKRFGIQKILEAEVQAKCSIVIKLGSQQKLPIREDKRKIGCDGGKSVNISLV